MEHSPEVRPLLEGLRVLDLSTIVAGPTASMVLADLGAHVIKVEPIGGEPGRQFEPHRGPWGAYFTPLNRGKRSICINLSKPEGRELVLKLAATCDVFLENLRGGHADEIGLSEAAVRARRPDVIYAALSAYGSRGPDHMRPGYDAVVQARSGIMSVTGPEDGAPIRAGVSVLDVGTGVWMAVGILAALLERQRSGQGQRVDASLLGTGVTLMLYHLTYRQFTGQDPKRQGSHHLAFAPYGAYKTADGMIMLGISSEKSFLRLCDAVEHPEWKTDPRFDTNAARVRNMREMDTTLETVLVRHPTAYWREVLNRFNIAHDPVMTPGEILEDPQIQAEGQMVEVQIGGQGTVLAPRLPIELSRTPAEVRGPVPAAGEHTLELLREAGFAETEIQQWIASGICKGSAQ